LLNATDRFAQDVKQTLTDSVSTWKDRMMKTLNQADNVTTAEADQLHS
jgi:hypothetical protein